MRVAPHPLLQLVPLGAGVLELVVIERHGDLAQEVVATERVVVPHRHPQRARLQLALADVVLKQDHRGVNIPLQLTKPLVNNVIL